MDLACTWDCNQVEGLLQAALILIVLFADVKVTLVVELKSLLVAVSEIF